MPIYEFECEECGNRFEELVGSGDAPPGCSSCGAPEPKRLISNVSPPGRLPRGAGVRDADSRRVDREAARSDRISTAQKRRAADGSPRPGGGDG